MTRATDDLAGETQGWYPLLRVSSVSWLGENEGDEGTLWTRRHQDVARRLDLDRPVACLPLLERPYGVVLDELVRARATCGPGTVAALDRVVPGVIDVALGSGSVYWIDGAFSWLTAMVPSERTAGWARTIEDLPVASQATRHQARRVRRRWLASR